MALVAINLGYELGVVPRSLFCVLVLMALATTATTTPLLRVNTAHPAGAKVWSGDIPTPDGVNQNYVDGHTAWANFNKIAARNFWANSADFY